MKNKFMFPVFMVMLMFSSSYRQAQNPELDFTIAFTKTSYSGSEPVRCTISLKNNSARDVVINKRFLVNYPTGPHEISFQITGPDKKPVPFLLKINADFIAKDYRVLHPGEAEIQSYKLSGRYDFNQPGKYNVRAYYENKYDAPAASGLAPAWKGQLASNMTSFEIQ